MDVVRAGRLPWTVGSAGPARARLTQPGAWRWYPGALMGLAYQGIEVYWILTGPGSPAHKAGAVAVLVVFYVVYLVLPPLIWAETVRTRVIALGAYWAASFLLWPLVGPSFIWLWTSFVCMAAFTWVPRTVSIAIGAVVVVAQVLITWGYGWPDSLSYAWFITSSLCFALTAFAGQIRQSARLRQANAEIGRLAVADERARLARDLHDSLGHSLTVVAVKSELAARLVESDPARAAAEIHDVQDLARAALADLRASVAGFRDVSLDTELATARTALAAAGVAAEVPAAGDSVRTELRPLFGWAVREAVTNVIRHGGATTCRIELGRDRLRVVNDGPVAQVAPGGNGLAGLRERAAAAGASVAAGALPDGGFELVVAR